LTRRASLEYDRSIVATIKQLKGITPIVIIGAGPAGIGTAVEAIRRGYRPDQIVILEKSGQIADMIVRKYPEEKRVLANYKGVVAERLGSLHIGDMDKDEFLEYMRKLVEDNGLSIRFHEQVQQITQLRNGQLAVRTDRNDYISDSVFVAIGSMAAPRTLGVPVEAAASGRVLYDLQHLGRELKRVLVVGGGDSAGEYAAILQERGHEVTLSYRQREFGKMLPANAEITLALIAQKKLRFLPASNLERIEDADGRARVHFKESPGQPEDFDAIVAALGTEKPLRYLSSIGIETVAEGAEIYSEAQLSGLFLVGDLGAAKKGGSINFAFNSGVKAFERANRLYLEYLGESAAGASI
jgi:thioredoxin reductase (NADPH)